MPNDYAVKTGKVSDRRKLSFTSMAEILGDIEKLNAAEKEGKTISATVNWTPAQIIEHVVYFVDCSIDGFEFKAPLVLRIFGKFARSPILNNPMKPGFKLPATMRMVIASPKSTWQDAVSHARKAILRVEAGKQMTKPSPLLGKMSHQDWVKLHCRHAEMHLSFIKVK